VGQEKGRAAGKDLNVDGSHVKFGSKIEVEKSLRGEGGGLLNKGCEDIVDVPTRGLW